MLQTKIVNGGKSVACGKKEQGPPLVVLPWAMQVGDERKPQRKVAVIVEQIIDTLLRNELSAGQIWFC